MNIKIIFFGSFGKFSKIYLECLKKAGFEIILAVEDKKVDFKNIESEIIKNRPDLGVIAYFGKIIPKSILILPKNGFVNAHPSLLPRWRGPSPIQNTILAGDTTTGVTIHLTTNQIDAGGILAQKLVPIPPNDTCATLTEKLAKEGAELIVEIIPKWINGEINPVSQDESKATYTKIIKKEDGLIDWSKSPEYIEKMVRAYDPWPGTYTLMGRRILKIKKVEIIDKKLKIITVQPEGKKDMPYEAFLRGHKDFSLL